jgi:hypothetical protein
LLRNDFDKTYKVLYNELLQLIEKKVKAPHSVSQESEYLKEYVKRFFDKTCGKIDYRDMILDLYAFDYHKAMKSEGSAVPPSHGSTRSEESSQHPAPYSEPKSMHEDDFIVLDSKKVPQNVIEKIEKRTIRMNRKLKRVFKSKEEVDKLVAEQVKPDANGNVSVDQLRDFVLSLCEEDLVSRKLSKGDIESFLSAFNYNAYGATAASDIGTLIFTPDD